MRIWSLHPKYLDAKGLVALWRETLLAKHVLENKTKGYKSHPQLDRFKKAKRPLDVVNQYLSEIYKEASNRNYRFNKNKIDWKFKPGKITVTDKQLEYEVLHLLKKLKARDTAKFEALKTIKNYDTLEMFTVIKGGIEKWEVISPVNKEIIHR
jgi:Pyrimidine dimer DNA glycosylase